jgi:hypothetical protein
MNNPPAFPSGYDVPENPGMSLRDYFAAKAMQSFCSDHKWRDKNTPDYPFLDRGTLEGNTAIAAYKMADAMLKAREA